jgi:NitT/TauT family transport system substrate-binding protein
MAILKANDLVAQDPAMAAKLIIDKKIRPPALEKPLAQAFREIPYGKWRDYNPEETIRFYALRLRELGMTKYSPNEIIAQNSNWSFLNSLKSELGMTW